MPLHQVIVQRLKSTAWVSLADRLSQYSRAQRWQEMAKLIDNDVLHTYAVVGTYDEIGDLLKARFG